MKNLTMADVTAAVEKAEIKGEQHALWIGVKVEGPAYGYTKQFVKTQVEVIRTIITK